MLFLQKTKGLLYLYAASSVTFSTAGKRVFRNLESSWSRTSELLLRKSYSLPSSIKPIFCCTASSSSFRASCSETVLTARRQHFSMPQTDVSVTKPKRPFGRTISSCSNGENNSGNDCGDISFIGQEQAIKIDLDLFNNYGFSVDQLMELAGLSCAMAIAEAYPRKVLFNQGRVLILCGSGNNGGDGLICARHLLLYGYECVVYYPKRNTKPLFTGLVTQCEMFGVTFVDELPSDRNFDIIVDALFGFSFKPPVRPMYEPAIAMMKATRCSVCSIDIPSGWDVDEGNATGIQPDMLISLTAPKKCARHFKGRYHYLGGRFLPEIVKEKFGLTLPEYPGVSCCMQICV